LVERAHLEPRDAIAVADAIRDCLRTDELVTKSFLEARLTAFKAELKGELKGEILQHMYFAMLGQCGALTGMMYFFTAHLR
jgi:hypothetical protein